MSGAWAICCGGQIEQSEEICVGAPRGARIRRPPLTFDEVGEDGAAATANARLKFWSSGHSRQHPDKSAWTNADAFFASDTLLGIADGVSAVELEGYDPSKLPIELLLKCQELHRLKKANPIRFCAEVTTRLSAYGNLTLDEVKGSWPKYLMAEAFLMCETLGATTALLVAIDTEQAEPARAVCHSANVGDSQYMLLRFEAGAWKVVDKSNPQVHWFNCPYQLTRMPDTSMTDQNLYHQVSIAASGHLACFEGDVLVVATDGVFDNLFDEQIVGIVASACNAEGEPQVPPLDLAQRIVDGAIHNASVHDKETGKTPFSQMAQTASGRTIYGGKPDDTTAAVAYVVRAEAADAAPNGAPVRLAENQSSPLSEAPVSTVAAVDLPPTATPRGPRDEGIGEGRRVTQGSAAGAVSPGGGTVQYHHG
jgi:serine/threonine protein phosphatase PrpC